MYTTKRSRRVWFPTTPGAEFLGWNGPNFMQQTNFTGFVEPAATSTNVANGTAIAAEWPIAALSLATGDLLVIEVGVDITNDDGAIGGDFIVYLKDQAGYVCNIGTVTLAATANGKLDLSFPVPIKAAAKYAEANRTQIRQVGGVNTVLIATETGADGKTPDTLQVFLDVPVAVNTVKLRYAMATRVRAGI